MRKYDVKDACSDSTKALVGDTATAECTYKKKQRTFSIERKGSLFFLKFEYIVTYLLQTACGKYRGKQASP